MVTIAASFCATVHNFVKFRIKIKYILIMAKVLLFCGGFSLSLCPLERYLAFALVVIKRLHLVAFTAIKLFYFVSSHA